MYINTWKSWKGRQDKVDNRQMVYNKICLFVCQWEWLLSQEKED